MTTYYKWLNYGGIAPFSNIQWNLPKDSKPGEWMPKIEDIKMCESGYHVVEVKDLSRWIRFELYEVEVRGRGIHSDDKSVFQQARLIRKLNWGFPQIVEFANQCADAADNAARAATYAAARAAARAAAYAAAARAARDDAATYAATYAADNAAAAYAAAGYAADAAAAYAAAAYAAGAANVAAGAANVAARAAGAAYAGARAMQSKWILDLFRLEKDV